MSIEIKVPQLPESVSDATLVAWHKKVGDAVTRDENLVDLETDKVVLEVPAPSSGTLREIRIKDGTTVTAGDVLAVLGAAEEADGAAAGAEDGGKDEEETAAGDGDKGRNDAGGDGDVEETDEEDEESSGASAHKLSPSVRRLLSEHDLDVGSIGGSGKDGRVTKADVMKYLKSHGDEDVTPGDAVANGNAGDGRTTRTEQRVPMTRLRARIAERMVTAQQSAAMLTTFNEIDLTKVMSLRKPCAAT